MLLFETERHIYVQIKGRRYQFASAAAEILDEVISIWRCQVTENVEVRFSLGVNNV